MTKEYSFEQPIKPNVLILHHALCEVEPDYEQTMVLLNGGTTPINGDYIRTNRHSNTTIR